MNVQPRVQKMYLGVRLTPELKNKLEGEAERMATTATDIVRRALREYFFNRRNVNRKPVR